ncbi:leucine-rich repeat protein [Prochlorococcus sp. MIT 0707]|uniref:leucine-rich repeat protein n=1 Tax=Prochlorococcus sp. MIT 0707 TaxID=3082860 RepID=UPI0039A544C5
MSVLTTADVDTLVEDQGNDLIIPNGVTEIGSFAFFRSSAKDTITSVVIPDSVTSIGFYAFGSLSNLKSIDLGNGVESIGGAAFKLTALESIVIPDSVTSLGEDAFFLSKLKSVVIGDGITSIPEKAFKANDIDTLVIGKNVTSIGEDAFTSNDLTNVIIPIAAEYHNDAFDSDTSILFDTTGVVTSIDAASLIEAQGSDVSIPDTFIAIGDNAFEGTSLTSVVIPDSVTSIGDSAFRLTPLTSVEIPDSVTEIGDNVFRDTDLTSVVIPDSVTKIGSSAFLGTAITSVEIPNSVTEIGDQAFFGTQLTSIEIPDSVTSIGDSAFSGSQLTSVVIPNSVTSIGDYVFYQTQLTSVQIPNSVTSIGQNAFQNTQLTSVEIGDNVTRIGKNAFASTKLTSVVIPDRVTKIDDGAFSNTELTSVELGTNVIQIGHDAFSGTQLKSLDLPNKVTSIRSNAFNGTQIASVLIPATVTSIGANAFAGTQLTSVVVPAGIQIDEGAFDSAVLLEERSVLTNADALTLLALGSDVTIPEEYGWISREAFEDTQLTSVVIPNSVTEIAEQAFKDTPLTTVVIGDGVTSIGDYAFSGTQLTSLALGNSVTEIGGGAFSGSGLTSVELPDSLKYIGNYTFSNTKLTSVEIPNGVTSIGDNAFRQSPLTSVVIGDGVTSIGDGAFSNTNLTNVVIPESVTSIAANAFAGTQLSSILIPEDTEVHGDAFDSSVEITRGKPGPDIRTDPDIAKTWNTYTTTPPADAVLGNSAYVIVDGHSWEEAEANAVKLNGNLVTLNTAAEQTWLTTTFNQNIVNNGDPLKGVAGKWTGLTTDLAGRYKWSSGEITPGNGNNLLWQTPLSAIDFNLDVGPPSTPLSRDFLQSGQPGKHAWLDTGGRLETRAGQDFPTNPYEPNGDLKPVNGFLASGGIAEIPLDVYGNSLAITADSDIKLGYSLHLNNGTEVDNTAGLNQLAVLGDSVDLDDTYRLDITAKSLAQGYNLETADVTINFDPYLFNEIKASDITIGSQLPIANAVQINNDAGTIRIAAASLGDLAAGQSISSENVLASIDVNFNERNLAGLDKNSDGSIDDPSTPLFFGLSANQDETVFSKDQIDAAGLSNREIKSLRELGGELAVDGTKVTLYEAEINLVEQGDGLILSSDLVIGSYNASKTNLVRKGDTITATSQWTNVGNIEATDIAITAVTNDNASLSSSSFYISTTEGESYQALTNLESGSFSSTTGAFDSTGQETAQLFADIEITGAAGNVVDLSQGILSLKAEGSEIFENKLGSKNLITYQGDLNYDGRVSMKDLAYLNAGAARQQLASEGQAAADVNKHGLVEASVARGVDANFDGQISMADLAVLDADWGQSLHQGSNGSESSFTGSDQISWEQLDNQGLTGEAAWDNQAFKDQNAVEAGNDFVESLESPAAVGVIDADGDSSRTDNDIAGDYFQDPLST